jgi:D-tyrosyl-tRNA(Tyr) deacylase
MKAVLQRVQKAGVAVQDKQVASIGKGLVILLGIGPEDDRETAKQLAGQIARLRIFEDDQGKMNLSLLDIGGEALVVPQFTLYADTSRGHRPSFTGAAAPDQARGLVETFALLLSQEGVLTRQGRFGTHMLVSIYNDGPVTIQLAE